MSRIGEYSDEIERNTNVFMKLAQAIGNTDYEATGFEDGFKGLAKTMAYVNKIGYATLPFYFRLKSQVETSLLAVGKLTNMLTGQGEAAGVVADAFEYLGEQFTEARDILEYSTNLNDLISESANFVTFGLAGKAFEGTKQIGSAIKDFATSQGKIQIVMDGLFAFGRAAEERGKAFAGSVVDKIKRIPIGVILTNLGAFALTAMKVFFAMSLAITGLLFLVKSKVVQNTLKRLFGVLMEIGAVIFDALKIVFDGFMLIFKAFTGEGGFMKSLGMALKGLGKIFFGILKGLFGVAFVVLKGLVVVVLGALFDLGKYIVEGLKAAGSAGLRGAKFLGNVVLPGTPFAMARGGVSSGGLTLVGEEGPELVRLPTGARVYSNPQSRRMTTGTTNNITVNVQGRIGASDTELRQIASKIGQMINKEVNRTTSSRGTLG